MTEEERRAEHEAGTTTDEGQRGLSQAITVSEGEKWRKPERRNKVFELKDVTVSYNGKPAVRDISFDVFRHNITALIGPSGCGKSTLIRCFNRMNDLISGERRGQILYHGDDLYASASIPSRSAS